MSNISKSFSLLIVLVLIISSLIIAKPVFAQVPTPTPIPTSSVPSFTLQLVGPPYIQPTTYQLDQSTGQIVANIGYTNEYSDIVVIIKNQPLVFDYNDTYGIGGAGAFGFYYNIQIKAHNETGGWDDLYNAYAYDYPLPSDSDYTNISISIEGRSSCWYSNRCPSTSNDRANRS